MSGGREIHGLELSQARAKRISGEPGPGAVPVTNGDMTNGRVPGGPFRLVHLAANTNMNVTTHDEQLAVFAAESLWIETPCFPRVTVHDDRQWLTQRHWRGN